MLGAPRAVDLQGVAVVPLDGALDLLAVQEDDDHLRVRVHLLLVVEDLRVGLGGRNLLAPDGLAAADDAADELARLARRRRPPPGRCGGARRAAAPRVAPCGRTVGRGP